MNGCIELSRQRPPHPAPPPLPTSFPPAAPAAGVPRPLRNPARRFQRMHQLELPVASFDPGSRRSRRWSGGNPRRRLVDSFRSDAARTLPPGRGETPRSPLVRGRSTGLLLLNTEKTPEKDSKSVTHVPGLNCYLSPRPYKGSALLKSRGRFFVAALLRMTGVAVPRDDRRRCAPRDDRRRCSSG